MPEMIYIWMYRPRVRKRSGEQFPWQMHVPGKIATDRDSLEFMRACVISHNRNHRKQEHAIFAMPADGLHQVYPEPEGR